MRTNLLYLLFVLAPTEILPAEYNFVHLEGYWEDVDGHIQIEIQDHRKGIKVRELDHRYKSKWRTYNDMGRGVYDDCDGNVLILSSRGELKWKRSFDRRPVYLVRQGYSYRNSRDYDRAPISNSRYDRYSNSSRYAGNWYCDQFGLDLEISLYGNGFRARNADRDWVYYDRYEDNDYRDKHGNRYCFEEGNLVWCSSDGKRRFRFNKR